LVADFNEIQEDSSSRVESREEHRNENKVAETVHPAERDVRTDHPTSTLEVQCDRENVQPVRFSRAKQEVPESVAELDSEELNEDFSKSDTEVQQTAGHGSVEPDEGYGASNVDNEDLQRSVDLEETKLEKYEELWEESKVNYERTRSTITDRAMNTGDIEDTSGMTVQDRTHEIETEEAAPTTDNIYDVINRGEEYERNSRD